MYRQHFGLNRSPFSIEPDPDFLWLGDMHQEGLSILRYGILENKGFLLLTGDTGTGKTVLIKHLLTILTADVIVATIPNPNLTRLDFFNILSHELGMDSPVDGKADFLIKFKKFIRDVYASQRRLLIIVDEAQRLTNELIDEIRVLSNIDYDNRKLIDIFFVGQLEFNQILTDPCNRALRQRITVSYHLTPLNQEDTDAYIRHRLKVAGTQKDLFLPEAVHEIFKFTNGTPRLINILCDHALITGYARDLNRVDRELICECARELDISSGAATPDIKIAPQTENHSVIEEKIGQARVLVKPAGKERKWMPAAIVGALALLFWGVYLMRPPEKNEAPASPLMEARTSDVLQTISSDSERLIELTPPQRPEAPQTIQPEPPIGIELPVSEKKTAPPPELGSKSIELRGHRFLLFFKPGSAELEEGSYEILRQVSDFLIANPNSGVTLTCQSTQGDSPGLGPKLWKLRAASIRSVLSAQPKFKGKIIVIDSYVQGAVEDQVLAGRRLSKPWAEIRVEPEG